MLRWGAPVALIAATAAVAVSGPATASTSPKAGATVITMELDGKEPFFGAPETVARGATLKIKNNTNPQKVGPHTFSLANRKEIPQTKEEIMGCSHHFKGICGAIAEWHEVDFQNEEIGQNPVEVGKEGWNQQGNLKRKGDSWFAFSKGDSFKREVTAPEGKTLHFVCAIHSEMQGKIRVEG